MYVSWGGVGGSGGEETVELVVTDSSTGGCIDDVRWGGLSILKWSGGKMPESWLVKQKRSANELYISLING
jgi:hypothetical protein